jgi:hypothetical protein
VSITLVVCTRVPLVPVIVIVLVPASAPLAAVRVRVVVPEDVSDTGLNFPVTFAGNPLTENFVTPTNPKLGVSVRATLPLIPPRVIATALVKLIVKNHQASSPTAGEAPSEAVFRCFRSL